MKKQQPLAVVAVCAVTALTAGCGSSDSGGSGSGEDGAESGGTLTVLAASSLAGTFGDLEETFEADHEGVDVKLVLDSSATLAQMAEEGAPGDVLATADQATMDEATTNDGVSGDPTQFATNVLVVVTPADNPGKVTKLSDLDKAGVDWVACVPTAPCGAAAQTLLKANGIQAKPASEEVDVKSTLEKVVSGEADAGLVYATDAVAAGDDVTEVEIPGADDDPNTYWIARTANAQDEGLADDWLELVTSDEGQQVLTDAGFGTG